jgi:hypothetical protein
MIEELLTEEGRGSKEARKARVVFFLYTKLDAATVQIYDTPGQQPRQKAICTKKSQKIVVSRSNLTPCANATPNSTEPPHSNNPYLQCQYQVTDTPQQPSRCCFPPLDRYHAV